MDKTRIAFNTEDMESCFKVLKQLTSAKEKIFCTTKKWLEKGECRYKYIIFDVDQWTGYDKLEQVEFRANGDCFIKKFEEIKL